MVTRGREKTASKREFLKSTGISLSGLVGVGTAGIVSGKERDATGGITIEEYRGLLLKRKREGWSVERWRKELANRGGEFNYADSSVEISMDNEGNVNAKTERLEPVDERDDREFSSNALSEHTAKLKLTYTTPEEHGLLTDYNLINFSWSVDDGWATWAEPPVNYATMSISDEQYKWTDPEVGFGPYTSASEAVEAQSRTFYNAQHNADAHAMVTTGRFGSWMDKGIEPKSDSGGPEDRKIYVDYIARHSKTSINGVSVTSNGDASISFSTETGLWRAETAATEAKMDDGATYVDDDPL